MEDTMPEVEDRDAPVEDSVGGSQRIRHDFEDDTTGEPKELELGVTYIIISTAVELGDGELVFTHQVRELV